MIKLRAEQLNSLLWYGRFEDENKQYNMVQDEHTGKGRWSEYHEVIFTDGERFWGVTYEEGLTEQQETDRWIEDKDGYVECYEVWPVEKTITVYTNKNDIQ